MANWRNSFLLRALRRKPALVGIVIIAIFILIGTVGAATAPYPDGYNPSAYYAASPTALPGWISIFPGFGSLPPNIIYPPNTSMQGFKSQSAVNAWQPVDPPTENVAVTFDSASGPTGLISENIGSYTLINTGPGSELVNTSGDSQTPFTINFVHTFAYSYRAPSIFMSQIVVKPLVVQGAGVAVSVYVKSSKGIYPIALEANLKGQAALESLPKVGPEYTQYFTNPISPSTLLNSTWNYVGGITTADSLMPLYYVNSTAIAKANPTQFAAIMFQGPGNYTLGEAIQVFPKGQYSVQLQQSDLKSQIFGLKYGLMGTDVNGADVWSEFATGTSIALEIAFGATAIALTIGVVVGLVGGFFGGIVDGVLLGVTDVLLLLPFLIFLIDLDTIFTLGHVVPNKVVLIIVLFGALGWAGISRTIRSQALSLRSRTYVTAATAMGASKLYILRRHVLNHTAGTIFALATFLVPALLTLDAGIDYLGIGISTTPTWGNLLSNLLNSVNPANGYLWWIFLPVGFALIIISVAFFMAGRAIQEEYSRAA